jgi:hypothetical protein
MSRLGTSLIALGLLLAGLSLTAQEPGPAVPAPTPGDSSSLIPPAVAPVSPVAMFRRLLDMSRRERENYLTNRPPAIRAAIRAKIAEYLAMDPDARELRLRATELRWQLTPLLRLAPADRSPRLVLVPEDLAPLVKSRLAEWDQLPPEVQAEFLANDRTLHYFALVATTNQPPADPVAAAEHANVAEQFNQFFELTPDEKQKTLKTLSAAERAQMERTLQAFGQLPARQRKECLQAFTQFAGLSPADRAEFLQNAGRWAQLSPTERQTWRDLVARVPSWPPLPGTLTPPPMPPRPGPVPVKSHPAMATN